MNREDDLYRVYLMTLLDIHQEEVKGRTEDLLALAAAAVGARDCSCVMAKSHLVSSVETLTGFDCDDALKLDGQFVAPSEDPIVNFIYKWWEMFGTTWVKPKDVHHVAVECGLDWRKRRNKLPYDVFISRVPFDGGVFSLEANKLDKGWEYSLTQIKKDDNGYEEEEHEEEDEEDEEEISEEDKKTNVFLVKWASVYQSGPVSLQSLIGIGRELGQDWALGEDVTELPEHIMNASVNVDDGTMVAPFRLKRDKNIYKLKVKKVE